MDQHKQDNFNWDSSVYGTGPTVPPKSQGGAVALLLILVIFLCGIITVLGVLNIQLFQKLKTQEEHQLAFSVTEDETVHTEPVSLAETAPAQTDSASMNLHQSPQSIANVPQEGGLSLQDIYKENIVSVVSITCAQSRGSATGTGVIFSEDGYIITNAHVVTDPVTVTVQLTDDRVLPAHVVGSDEVSDLAVLKIQAKDLIPAAFGDSSALQVGDTVVAIGDPLGVEFRGTYTNGIVSAINRDVDVEGHTMTLIQTNAALNAGNSGGPLINCYGQVIGINTMKIGAFASSSGVEGLGFAIPSTTVKSIVDQLISQGYVSGRPTLGITGEALSIFEQSFYDWPAGMFITEVAKNSDACRKGIEYGDILVSVGEHRITSMTDLKAALHSYEVGETVTAVIFRGGQTYQVDLKLGEDKG